MAEAITKIGEEENKAVINDNTYIKDQILKSEKYSDRVDVINVLLSENETYTISQVDKLIKDFMNSEVK